MAAAYCHQHAQEPTSYRPPAVDAGGRCERKRKRRKAFGRVCRATTSNPSRGSPSARFGRPPRIVRLLTLIYLGRTEARRTGGWDRGCLARQTRRTAAFAWPAVALLAGCLYRRPWYLVCAASNQPTLQSLRACAHTRGGSRPIFRTTRIHRPPSVSGSFSFTLGCTRRASVLDLALFAVKHVLGAIGAG